MFTVYKTKTLSKAQDPDLDFNVKSGIQDTKTFRLRHTFSRIHKSKTVELRFHRISVIFVNLFALFLQ